MGFSTPSSINHHSSDSLSAALDTVSSMTPGIPSSLEPTKGLYFRDDESSTTMLCDEIGGYYGSQQQKENNKNFETVNGSLSDGGGNGASNTVTASTSVVAAPTTTTVPRSQACFCCNEAINDKWLIFVNNTHWHLRCLKCSSCSQTLNDLPTCFWRENRIFCKNCYQT